MKHLKNVLASPVCAIAALVVFTALTGLAYTPIYRGLPAGYTQVECIQSSGSQYIDLGINARVRSPSLTRCCPV